MLYLYKFVKLIHILKNQDIKLIRNTAFFFGLMFIHVSFGQTKNTELTTLPQDSISNTDSITPKKESSLAHTINYDAVDSIWFNVKKQEATLFGKAHLDYDDVNIDAPIIFVNLKNSTLEAQATYDSTGKVKEWPFLKQKDDQFQAKTIIFNYKTSRGYIEDVYTQEGEGFLHTNEAYLDKDKTMYIQDGSYTTCNLANPHFHFKMARAKIIPDDKIIASRINLYIDSIPTPLGVPFGLFPTKDKVSSGILMPTAASNQLGFFLRGLGYFWAISDSLTTKFTTELYSKGSYTLSNSTDYRVRYKYSGNFNIDYRKVLANSDEFNRNSNNTFRFTWQHRPESKRGRTMQADVDFQNQKFSTFSFSNNEQLSLPSINSSVTWNLPLTGTPFRAVVSLKHSQSKNTNSGEGSNTFNLPNYTINYSGERNPFKKLPYYGEKPSKFRKNILDQFNISYSNNGNSTLLTDRIRLPNSSFLDIESLENVKDTVNLGLVKDDVKDLLNRNKFYMTHTASIQNNIKIKAITFTPSFNYNEYWYFSKSDFEVDFSDSSYSFKKVRGFNRIARYSAGVNMSVPFYNFYTLGRVKTIKSTNDSTRGKKIDGQIKFRHQILPNIGFSTSPDYSEDNALFQTFENNNQSIAFERYFLYPGRPSASGKSRNINFSLSNILELKLPEKKSKQLDPDYIAKPVEPKKLLQLNGSASYNLAADSLKLSNLGFTASNNSLLNGLISFSASASFDPYQYAIDDTTTKQINEGNTRIDKYWAKDNGFFGRLQVLQLSSNISLNPESLKKLFTGENADTSKSVYFKNPDYLDFSLPWSMQLGYNYTWNVATPTSDTLKTNSLTASGTLKLSEKWSTSMNVNYNIAKKEFTYPNVSLNRDLHCWFLSLQWVPFGPANSRSYSFFIGVKASMLKDLKIRKQNNGYDRNNN